MIAKSKFSLDMFMFQAGKSGTGVLARDSESRIDVPQLLFRVLQQPANLFSEFRIVGVTMLHNRMIDGRIQHFLFGAFHLQRAAALARIVSAVD